MISTGITDEGLAVLKDLKNIRALEANHRRRHRPTEGMAQLENLNLSQTKASDAALDHLTGLTNLQIIFVHGTTITDAGIARLKKANPRVNVVK